jgi:hypothetical protein
MIPVSYRREAHLANGNCVVNILLPEQFCYISILETITSLFQVKEFVRCIINICEVFNRNDVGGVYQKVMDGSHLKTPRTKISAGWKLTVSFQRGGY